MKLDRELLKKTGLLGIVSTELVVWVIGSYFVGKTLDDWLGTEPVFSFAITCMGFIVAIYRLIASVKKF